MNYERYDNIIASSDKLEFRFISEGLKGKIIKVIQFTQTLNPGIYNLAFGDLKKDGSVDDEIVNNNRDRNKILATVAGAVYEFTSFYPGKFVFFCGTTPERTRLYRMALTINIEELKKDFQLYGVLRGIETFERVSFRNGVDYFGFMIKRKKSVTLRK